MSIEKIFPSGGWIVSAMINGYRVQTRHYGYTKKQAVKMFKEEHKVK